MKLSYFKMAKNEESSDSDGPIINDNVIRIQLRKSSQKKWELRTRNLSPGIKFPTIQLFDCEGNLLVETNDDNLSIKSCDFDDHIMRNTQSLREKDFKHFIDKRAIKKHNTISGDKVYTRIYKTSVNKEKIENSDNSYVAKDGNKSLNIPSVVILENNLLDVQAHSLQTTPFHSDGLSEISSYKSSDNECYLDDVSYHSNEDLNSTFEKTNAFVFLNSPNKEYSQPNKADVNNACLHKSLSFNEMGLTKSTSELNINLQRSKSGLMYHPPHNKVSFLNTYLKSLHARTKSDPGWLTSQRNKVNGILQNSRYDFKRSEARNVSGDKPCKFWDNTSDEFINIPTDVAADYEMRKRLKMYRRGLSEVEPRRRLMSLFANKRRHSVIGDIGLVRTSSSESVDEADVVLSRLKRRILKNRVRERRRTLGEKFLGRGVNKDRGVKVAEEVNDVRDGADGVTTLRCRPKMGSNISQHSAKGLKGRRARSSGDLCNGDTKSQTESSVCGSVVGEVMGWNRSLPNHLDGNRHLADYSRVNNNYGELTVYNRGPHKPGRGLRYRVSKSGSDAEPVWKLQDPGFDQGYGSERSPEEDFTPPVRPAVSLEQYEAELRNIYPFITEENTYTVVVEKDGRGLGMSVCSGAGGLGAASGVGLVRIRRLYPPQPAWRSGRLAPRDLLLAANGLPLAGLSTYEALEVLRTAPARVELRVCRPPPDVLESVTPPDPPTPPTRTPHPTHLPPLDPLNCHPMHARLSQTTSSATTSSSEGRGRRETSPDPERRDLHLPDLDRPLPIYDIQYGEFDIVMTKVNGSLGFTLRKEDHSALGHYVRALVREPALSDGRIQPGDRILAVNDTPMSNMSHAEAVAFLRACGSEVRLRLYRDHAATPLSPLSPREDVLPDTDAPLAKCKPPLRAEAVSMLCDLAARRLTPDASRPEGARSPCLSPRKCRRLTKDNNHYEQPNVAHRTYQLNDLDNDTLDAPTFYQEDAEPAFPADSDEPVSMPVGMSSDEARFKHSTPTYQSAVLPTTAASDGSSDINKEDNNRLKKWKGGALSPDNERRVKPEYPQQPIVREMLSLQKENVNPELSPDIQSSEPTIVTVELNRGWNSRLGFSVQSHPESGQSYISAVYDDSVAARDGRLRRGDVILQVNDENVTSMKTSEVIDLLRILRGSICITVLRPPNHQ